jgi:hypothetical protein
MASLGAPTDAPAFPQDPAEFDSDPRISWSRLDEKFILETEEGQEYEYDSGLKRWVFKVCSVHFQHCAFLASGESGDSIATSQLVLSSLNRQILT